MRIVDRKTLAAMPNGTVFCGYTPDSLDGDLRLLQVIMRNMMELRTK